MRTEVTEGFFRSVGSELLSDELIDADQTWRALRERVSGLIKDSIGCTMAVSLVAPGTVPRSEGGKLARVVDMRTRVASQ